MTYNVTIHLHPDQDPLKNYTLDEVLTIGRGASNRLVVRDLKVSSEHARIFERDGRLWYNDVGTTNGTYHERTQRRINNETIELYKRDKLKLGDLQLMIVDFVEL